MLIEVMAIAAIIALLNQSRNALHCTTVDKRLIGQGQPHGSKGNIIKDGIPTWVRSFCLNAKSARETDKSSRYTNLQIYLNSLGPVRRLSDLAGSQRAL